MVFIFDRFDCLFNKHIFLLSAFEISIQYLSVLGFLLLGLHEFRISLPFNTLTFKRSFIYLPVYWTECSPFIWIKALMFWSQNTILAQVDVELLWLTKAELGEVLGNKLLRLLYLWILLDEILTKLIRYFKVTFAAETILHFLSLL